MKPGEIDLWQVASIVLGASKDAHIANTGSSTATLYAGPETGGYFHAIVGPGFFVGGEAIGLVLELFVGPDTEDGKSGGVMCEAVGADTEEKIAALVLAQLRKPFGVGLTDDEARATVAGVRS